MSGRARQIWMQSDERVFQAPVARLPEPESELELF